MYSKNQQALGKNVTGRFGSVERYLRVQALAWPAPIATLLLNLRRI